MKRLFFMLGVGISITAFASDGLIDRGQEIIVPNVDADEPACRATIPIADAKCVQQTCDVAVPEKSPEKMIKLNFSCISPSANTGFEQPPDGAKIFPIQAANGKGSAMLIDELMPANGVRMRELYFCIFGERVTLCGNAKTMRLTDRTRIDGTQKILRLVRKIRVIDLDGKK